MKEVEKPLPVPAGSSPDVPRVRALDVSLEPESSLVRLRGHPSNYVYVKNMVKVIIRSLIEKQVTRVNLSPELTRMLGLDSHAATTLRLKQLAADTGCQSCTLEEPDYNVILASGNPGAIRLLQEQVAALELCTGATSGRLPTIPLDTASAAPRCPCFEEVAKNDEHIMEPCGH